MFKYAIVGGAICGIIKSFGTYDSDIDLVGNAVWTFAFGTFLFWAIGRGALHFWTGLRETKARR